MDRRQQSGAASSPVVQRVIVEAAQQLPIESCQGERRASETAKPIAEASLCTFTTPAALWGSPERVPGRPVHTQGERGPGSSLQHQSSPVTRILGEAASFRSQGSASFQHVL